MLLLDDISPSALAVDPALPPSSGRLHDALVCAWPRLAGRISFVSANVEDVPIGPDDVVVSSHACGALTDRILDRAVAAGARVAVLPCCHKLAKTDALGLSGWIDGAMAIDIARVVRLREAGYRTWTQTIPAAITPKNRLLAGARAFEIQRE
jgi:hypothetical protein